MLSTGRPKQCGLCTVWASVACSRGLSALGLCLLSIGRIPAGVMPHTFWVCNFSSAASATCSRRQAHASMGLQLLQHVSLYCLQQEGRAP